MLVSAYLHRGDGVDYVILYWRSSLDIQKGKIDYIALQCKYLIIKYIYTEHRIDNKGDTVVDWTVVESAHRRDYVG